MAGNDRDEGGAARPTQRTADGQPLEISSRGKVVIRSSSHPPGVSEPLSGPPGAVPDAEAAAVDPGQRSKRTTPAERPRGRRAARAHMLELTAAEERLGPQAAASGAVEAQLVGRESHPLGVGSPRITRWVFIALTLLGALASYLLAR